MELFLTRLKEKVDRFSHNIYVKARNPATLFNYILVLSLVGIFFYAFTLVTNAFTIPLSGDYVMQQIPFYTNGYDDWWHFFKTGEFVFWDSNTYLGANNIGSNSFYYILNPFFLPILLFPRALVPQGLAILMIVKNVLAGLVMRAYLRYMKVSEKTSRLFGLVYAFSGWMTYYLWFNAYMEVAVLFPLTLLGIEKLLQEQKPWSLILGLFLMGITNYFFLVSTALSGVMYALFRYFVYFPRKSWAKRGLNAVLGVTAFAFGILMSSYVLLPSLFTSLSSNRVGQAFYLSTLIEYFKAKDWASLWKWISVWTMKDGTTRDYFAWYPVVSFLFPTVSGRSSTLYRTGDYDNVVSSLFIYTPIMLLLIPSLIVSFKKKKVSHILALFFFLFALFTPFFYNLFYGFTVAYGRWQIFVVTVLILYLAKNYDEKENFRRWMFDVSFLLLMSLAIWAFIVAKEHLGIHYVNNGYWFRLDDGFYERFYVAIYQFILLTAMYLFMRFNYQKDNLTSVLLKFIAVEAIIMGTMYTQMHGVIFYVEQYDSGVEVFSAQRETVKKILKNDQSSFRVYNTNATDASNIPMRLGYNGLSFFHSVYNFEVNEFNGFSRIGNGKDGWAGGIQEKRYNLETFLGVKYYLMLNKWDRYSLDENGFPTYTYQNVPLGYERIEEYSDSTTTVYKNSNYIEGGFSYDNLIQNVYSEDESTSNFIANSTEEVLVNEEAYLKGAILKKDKAEEINAEFPSLSLSSRPSRNAKKEMTKLTVVTCPYIFDESKVNDFSDCETESFSEGYGIANSKFTPEYSAFYLEPKNETLFNNNDQSYFYALDLQFRYFATVFLYDENDELIVRDSHTTVDTWYKSMRGFYSDRPVKRIVILPKLQRDGASGSLPYPRLYSESYTDFLARLQVFKDYPLTDYTYTANTISFKTDYDEERFIVLNTPYDQGWKVKVRDGSYQKLNRKIYKAQGGFIGFVSGTGPSEYYLEYQTPYLDLGLYISFASSIFFGGSYLLYIYLLDEKKYRKYRQKGLRLDFFSR